MIHFQLKRPDPAMVLVLQSFFNGPIQPAGRKIRFHTYVQRLRSGILVQPHPKFFQFLLGQSPNRFFNFLYFFCAHGVFQ